MVPGPFLLNSFPLLQFGKTYRSSIRPLPRASTQWVSFIKSNPELPFFCPVKRRNKNLAFPIELITLWKRFKLSIYVCSKQLMLSTGLIKSDKHLSNISYVQNMRSEMNVRRFRLTSYFSWFVWCAHWCCPVGEKSGTINPFWEHGCLVFIRNGNTFLIWKEHMKASVVQEILELLFLRGLFITWLSIYNDLLSFDLLLFCHMSRYSGKVNDHHTRLIKGRWQG